MPYFAAVHSALAAHFSSFPNDVFEAQFKAPLSGLPSRTLTELPDLHNAAEELTQRCDSSDRRAVFAFVDRA